MTQLDMEPSRAATATPFRRDDREILGRFAYTYDLKRAYQDGVLATSNFSWLITSCRGTIASRWKISRRPRRPSESWWPTGLRALGEATFLATASGVRVEAEKLYSASAVWANIIPNLSAARVQREIEAREFIETFERDVGTIPDLSDMSLYSLSPYAHVKIYRLRESFDINTAPNFGFDRQQIFGRVSEDTNSSIYVTRMRSPVAWSTDDELIDVEYDLFIFYFDPQSSLLFICASSRGDGLYRRIVRDLVGYDPKILGLSELNRALKELERARFFNVG